MNARFAGMRLVCGAVLIMAFAANVRAAQSVVFDLVSGKTVPQTLAPGQAREYKVVLRAGQAATLRLIQDQNAIELEEVGPGAMHATRSTDAGRFARLQWTLIAAHPATWIMRVMPRRAHRPARYQIEWLPPHAISSADNALAAAEAALQQAEAARRDNSDADVAKVQAQYERAVSFYRSLHDGCGMQAAYIGLARYDLNVGQFGEAQRASASAVKLKCDAALTALALRAEALRSLSSAYGYQGDFKTAVRFANASLVLSRETGDLYSQEWTLGNQVANYRELGETARALQLAHAAKQLALQLGDAHNAVFDQENIAAIYLARGELVPALRAYRQTLHELRSAPNQFLEGLVWTDLGTLYNLLDDGDASLDAYDRANAIWVAEHNQAELAGTLWNQGFVALDQHQVERARQVFERALATTQTADLVNDRSHALEGLGRCDIADRRWLQARLRLQAALALAKQIGNPAAEIPVELALGDLERAQGHYAAARVRYSGAYTLARAQGDLNSQPLALAGLAQVALATGAPQSALDDSERAVALIENQRDRIMQPGLRSDYFVGQRRYYGLEIEILMRLAKEHPDKGYARRALETAERARGRALRDQFAERAVVIRKGIDPLLRAHVDAAEEQVRMLAYQQAQLPANASVAQRQALSDALAQAAARLDRARGRLYRSDPRFAELMRPQPLGESELRGLQPGTGSVILEYWLGRTQSYLWAVQHGNVTGYRLPSRALIDKRALDLRGLLAVEPPAESVQSITALASRVSAEAHQEAELEASLGRMLLGPAAAALTHRTVVIIGDGELNRLPFNVLRASADAQPLGVSDDVVYLPSITTLRWLRSVQRPATGDAIALFVDPVFRPDDPRLPRTARQADGAFAALNGATQDVGLANLAFLPASEREAKTIAALAGHSPVWLEAGFGASRTAVLHANWSRYAIVHFAAHSLIDLKHPSLSGVVLSLYRPDDEPVDGFLRVEDLYNISMPVRLVVLSTCDSAAGPSAGAEGVFSLSRGFFYAGAAHVLASLWPVDDLASAHFMDLFYTALLQGHEPAPEALRTAQAEMAADARYTAPYYWAGYVLQGDWQ